MRRFIALVYVPWVDGDDFLDGSIGYMPIYADRATALEAYPAATILEVGALDVTTATKGEPA